MNWSSLFTSISCLLQYKRISDLYYQYSFFLLERRDGELARVALDDANDNAENTQSRSENLYNQNLYEQGGILRISNGTGRTGNADRNSRRDVGKADGKAGRKHAVTGVVIAVPVPVIVKVIGGLVGLLNLVCQNDGHDDTVNGGGLAKNDTVHDNYDIYFRRDNNTARIINSNPIKDIPKIPHPCGRQKKDVCGSGSQ